MIKDTAFAMTRIGISALALFLAAAWAASSSATAPTVVTFSLYAPARNDSPVHIAGFEHDRREFGLVLSNTSDKAVAAVDLTLEMIPPPGCGAKSEIGDHTTSRGGDFPVWIRPHGKAIVSLGIGRYPVLMVYTDRNWGAPYLQAQFGISGIVFKDGSKWPDPPHDDLRPALLDRRLAESEAGKCSGGADVSAALADIKEVEFGPESPQASDPDDKSALPHFRFSCSLEGPKAICHMPLEKGQGAPKSAEADKK